ncbi:MAG: metallophosphoesterase [Nanoarchaeota archaeon]
MKILAFVDMHESKKAFEKIKKLSKKADLIVCAGDLTIFENKYDILLDKLNKLKKPVLIIHGNHEDENDLEVLSSLFENITCIHEKSHAIEDYLFLGYGGGGFATIDTRFDKIAKKFEKSIKKYKKVILVTHAPPYKTKIDDIAGEPCGNKNIKKFILKNKPDLVISGHLHENAGKEDRIGKTLIVNPGPYGKILEI